MNANWTISEDIDGTLILRITYENGITEDIPIRGLPPAGAARTEMLFQTAQSIMAHRVKEIHRQNMKELGEKFRVTQAALEESIALVKSAQNQSVAPPRLAEHCISFLAPTNTAQALLGDMQEMFQKNLRRLGEPEARRLYWMEVRASAGKWVFDWLMRIGFLTAIVNYFRSKFGL